MKTKQLTSNAMLAAMCAVLGYVAIDLGNIKITLQAQKHKYGTAPMQALYRIFYLKCSCGFLLLIPLCTDHISNGSIPSTGWPTSDR